MDTAATHLKALALAFANDKKVKDKEFKKSREWKKIIKLPTSERYQIVLFALRGLVQSREPGFKNGLWLAVINHDLDYMLRKGNKQFLYEAANELKKVNSINTLPFPIYSKVIQSLFEHDFETCLSVLLDYLYKKYDRETHPSTTLEEFIATLKETYQLNSTFEEADILKEFNQYGNFEDQKPNTSSWQTYFVDSHETEEAWQRLDNKTKEVVQNYESELFYDRGPQPSQTQKDKTIETVQNSKLNKQHKKALIESIKKKG